MTRATALAIAFLAVLAPAPSLLGQLGNASGQNVLILIADDLGVDQVGAYGEGSSPAATPHIDALAQRGVLFRNAWSNPTCSPTRTSINTGRYTFRHSVGDWIRYPNNVGRTGTLQAREFTIPEVLDLASSGYAHAAFGKWHMNTIEEGPTYPTTVGGWGTFMGTMHSPNSFYYWEYVVNGAVQWTRTYATTKQVDDAISWIQARNSPWVCYLAFSAPHTPYHAPPGHLHSRNLSGLSPTGPLSEQREFYKAAVEAMDAEMGRLFATLGPAVLANTNVLFLGDNGTPLGLAEAPFLPTQGKTTPYEGGINVPLIIAGPQVFSGAREEPRLVSVVDIFSTVIEIAGAERGVPSYVEIDGRSLVPYLQSATGPPVRTTVFADRYRGDEWPDPITDMSGFGMAMIRNDRFKLIVKNTGPEELYDLASDPFERSNLMNVVLSGVQAQNYQALRTEMDALRVAPRRVFHLGENACVGSSGAPRMQVAGVPGIGAAYSVQLRSAAPGRPCFLVTGLSELSYLGTSLPIDLAALGAGPGCLLEYSIDVVIPETTSPLGSADVLLTIPNSPIFVDLPLYHGFVIHDPPAPGNGIGFVTSEAVATRIGR